MLPGDGCELDLAWWHLLFMSMDNENCASDTGGISRDQVLSGGMPLVSERMADRVYGLVSVGGSDERISVVVLVVGGSVRSSSSRHNGVNCPDDGSCNSGCNTFGSTCVVSSVTRSQLVG